MFFVRGRGYLHSDLHRAEPRRRMPQPSSCFLSIKRIRQLVIPATKSQEDNFGPKSKCDTSCATTFQYHVVLTRKVKPFNQSQVQIDKVFKLSSWILRCKQQKTTLKERMRWGSPVAALGDGNAESWVIRWMCVCVYECNITPIARYQTCFNLMYRQLDVRNQSHAAFPSLWKTSLRSSYNWSLIPWHAELNRKDWKWTN